MFPFGMVTTFWCLDIAPQHSPDKLHEPGLFASAAAALCLRATITPDIKNTRERVAEPASMMTSPAANFFEVFAMSCWNRAFSRSDVASPGKTNPHSPSLALKSVSEPPRALSSYADAAPTRAFVWRGVLECVRAICVKVCASATRAAMRLCENRNAPGQFAARRCSSLRVCVLHS